MEREPGKHVEWVVLPSTAAIYVSAVISLCALFFDYLFPSLMMPVWIYPFVLGVAFEGVYVTAFFVSARTPTSVRFLEFAFAGGIPFIIAFYTSSIAFSWVHPTLLFPAIIGLFTWSFAASYGGRFQQIRKVADQLGDQKSATLSWEHEAMNTKGPGPALTVEYFAWQIMAFSFIIGILAIVASRYLGLFSGGLSLNEPVFWLLLVALTAGLSLQGAVYLYRLLVVWDKSGISVPSALVRNWVVYLLVGALLISSVAMVLPSNISPVTIDSVTAFLMRVLGPLMNMEMPEMSTQEGSQAAGPEQPWQEVEVAEEDWITAVIVAFLILVFIIVALAIIAIIGFALLLFFKDEWEKLSGAPKVAITVYLWFKKSFNRITTFLKLTKLSTSGLAMPKIRISQGSKEQAAKESIPSAPALYVRYLFRTLRKRSVAVGVKTAPSQTPGEFGRKLEDSLAEDSRSAVKSFFEHYHRVRYSNHPVLPEIKTAALDSWKRIIDFIQSTNDERGGHKD